MNNGPELWGKILSHFPKGSIIAGGAVRDYFMDGAVEPKDIDVFIPPPDSGIYCFPEGFEEFPDISTNEYAAMNDVLDGNNMRHGKLYGFEVDAIYVKLSMMRQPEEPFGLKVVTQFDFGITRCWYDETGVHQTFASAHDIEKGRVTLLITDRLERAHARFQRLNDRYGQELTPVNFPPLPTEEELFPF